MCSYSEAIQTIFKRSLNFCHFHFVNLFIFVQPLRKAPRTTPSFSVTKRSTISNFHLRGFFSSPYIIATLPMLKFAFFPLCFMLYISRSALKYSVCHRFHNTSLQRRIYLALRRRLLSSIRCSCCSGIMFGCRKCIEFGVRKRELIVVFDASKWIDF